MGPGAVTRVGARAPVLDADVRRLYRLQELTAALAETMRTDAAALVVLRQAATLPGVVRGGLALIAAGGRELRFLAMHDESLGPERANWCSLDAVADLPLVATTRLGQPLWFPTMAALAARYPGLAEHQAAFGTRAFATVPLRVLDDTLGAVMLCYGVDQPFDEAEQAFLAAFTEQAAHALRRAQAFEEQQATAQLLQRTLLPNTLPDLPGLALAARYEPADGKAGVEIGGDWYDVLPLDGDEVLVVIGDVMGRGVAAATAMGQVRSALRAYALLDSSPGLVLQRLDRLVCTLGEPEQIVTVLVGVVSADRRSVRLASAGHLPPVLAVPGSPATTVHLPVGPPLGLHEGERGGADVPLPPGATLVLCTDGLVESRRTTAEEGLAQLADHLDSLRRNSDQPRDLATGIVAAMTEVGADDDRALLLITSTVGRAVRSAHMPLPADARAPAQARRWLAELLAEWAVPGAVRDDAVLCLSEIVTNAVIHTRTGARAAAVLDGRQLVVTVSDSGQRGRAERVDHNHEDVGGRGLTVVDALCSRWGSEQRSDGTTVWFELNVAARPADAR
jgi:serine phosphatase RsbU (regulator of sigma subunit)/anti-sigma regulatory factor (Ser/Thr protein kinase)